MSNHTITDNNKKSIVKYHTIIQKLIRNRWELFIILNENECNVECKFNENDTSDAVRIMKYSLIENNSQNSVLIPATNKMSEKNEMIAQSSLLKIASCDSNYWQTDMRENTNDKLIINDSYYLQENTCIGLYTGAFIKVDDFDTVHECPLIAAQHKQTTFEFQLKFKTKRDFEKLQDNIAFPNAKFKRKIVSLLKCHDELQSQTGLSAQNRTINIRICAECSDIVGIDRCLLSKINDCRNNINSDVLSRSDKQRQNVQFVYCEINSVEQPFGFVCKKINAELLTFYGNGFGQSIMEEKAIKKQNDYILSLLQHK